MNFKEWIIINEVKQIGYDKIQQKKMFGPVYHGTSSERFDNIIKHGFSVPIGGARTADVTHGYEISDYADGIPAPVHHLGFGVYLTTVKNIAKAYQGDGKNIKQFFVDTPRIETINFGSNRNMMKWWRNHGYDMPQLKDLYGKGIPNDEIENMRVKATLKMTENLKQKYDAVWFKGKGIRRLLDGDQICVYNPDKIYLFDPSLNPQDEFYTADRVKIKELPIAITIQNKRSSNHSNPFNMNPFDFLFNQTSNNYYAVKITSEDIEKIKKHYYDRIYNALFISQEFKELFSIRMQNSGDSFEDSVKKYTDYVLSESMRLNFPESLLEKKISKGERIK